MEIFKRVGLRWAESNRTKADIKWDKNNTIVRNAKDRSHLYASLGPFNRMDEGADMLSTSLSVLGDGPGTIEFIALPSAGYKSYLEKLRRPKDTFGNRRKYVLSAPAELLEQDWVASGCGMTDIAVTLLFSIPLPQDASGDKEYTGNFRLTQDACRHITKVLEELYGGGCKLFVGREVIHWGDYLQNPGRFFADGAAVLDGGPRTHMGEDLVQRFGSPMDARYMAPLLCLPVVLRRPLPRILDKDEGYQYLQECIPPFHAREADAIFEQLYGSEIPANLIYNRLMPQTLIKDELNQIFESKGCSYSVQ